METKEGLTRALMQEAEAGVLKLLEQLHELQEGDLKGLEQQVMATIFEIGRGWMQRVLSDATPEEPAPAERMGSCGHRQQLVGYRPKQILSLLGKLTFTRAYYQCVVAGEDLPTSTSGSCTHGEAPADRLWGVQGRRTTAGVQQAIGYLCATSTLEEGAASLSRLLPLQISARQALNLLQPLGEALQHQEDEQMPALWEQASQARTTSPSAEAEPHERSARLYIEVDGVTARIRRGSVPMEEQERQRSGDVYREVKVGAVFGANTPEAKAWVEHACSLLVEGQIEDLVTEIVVLPPIPPEPGASRSVPEIERDYFIKQAARLRYPAFRVQGMQVGSGIAEAGCKTVVSTRAKRSGMRWTPEGLDAVLAVRTAVLNETYDESCAQHLRLVA